VLPCRLFLLGHGVVVRGKSQRQEVFGIHLEPWPRQFNRFAIGRERIRAPGWNLIERVSQVPPVQPVFVIDLQRLLQTFGGVFIAPKIKVCRPQVAVRLKRGSQSIRSF
jgi:hypothetical protein